MQFSDSDFCEIEATGCFFSEVLVTAIDVIDQAERAPGGTC